MSLTFEASILNQLPDALIWVRPLMNGSGTVEDFEVGYSNQAADEGINHPKGSLTGLRILQDGVPSAESAPGNFQHYLDVYLSGGRKEYTFYAHHSNRVYETIRQPHQGGVLSITRDRQAQREAERKEQEKTQLLNGVVDNAPTGILVYESVRDDSGSIADFKVKLYNRTVHQLTGVPEEQRNELSFKDLLGQLHRLELFDQYVSTVETGTPFAFDFHSPNTSRWLHFSVVKLGDGFLVMLSDINEIKTLEQDLQRSAGRFKTVVNNSKAGMFTLLPVLDEQQEITDFRFEIVNQAVASYIGQTAEVLTGALGSEYFPAYKSNGLFRIYKDCYLNGTTHNFDFHYEDGYDVFFNITVIKMGDEVLVTFTDQSVLKRLQRDLESSVEELKRSNASLQEFAYAASHDLQEPLRKIHFFSDRLKRTLSSGSLEENTAVLERMEGATHRMSTLIDDLLAYSQVSVKPNILEPVELSDVVEMVLQDLERSVQESGAHITTDTLPRVKGDERQLRQLFQNLIGNGLKYRKLNEAPKVTIRHRLISATDPFLTYHPVMAKGNYYLIEVEDNGIGFEQENAEKIFQVFQRLHGRSEYPGTGVGLAIVQRIVTNHNGYIFAEGRPGAGATFRVLFPQ